MFVYMDKLDKYEFDIIEKELNPLFENDKLFISSAITTENSIDFKIRDSLSAFPPFDQLMETSIILQLKAKELFSKYVIFDEMIPDVQLLKYNPGQFYNWHTDIMPPEKGSGNMRVITVSLNFNDEYTGGGLEIKHNGQIDKLPFEPGSYTVFPSFLTHRAIPIETGCRKAVTLWIKGDISKLNTLKKLYDSRL
jgi:predicted 2-oxoglutarate/Fe(II)-dependent dioxygenase YbiX